MSLINEDSCECAKSELELFEIPPTQTSVEESRFEYFYPLTSLDRSGPIEFKITASESEYIDTSKTYIYFKARILDENSQKLVDKTSDDDATVPDKSVVYPISYFISSAFKQVEVHLNSQPVGSADSLYPYRAYMETVLSYGTDVKKHQLSTGLFYQDSYEMSETNKANITAGTTRNKGAKARWDKTKFSRSFEVMGTIHSEIFQQNKLIPSKVGIYLKFHRADPSFALMAADRNQKYKIQIEKATLIANIKKIASHVRTAHETRLLQTNARFPVRRVEMRYFTRGPGMSDLSEPNVVNGVLPKRIGFGLVSTDAFNGDLKKNPFDFQHFNASRVCLKQNGISVPFDALTLDYGNNEYVLQYFLLMHSTGQWNKDRSNGIHPFRDRDGYTMYAYNLTADQSHGSVFNLVREGNLSIEIKLKEPSTESITIVCYLEYDSIIEIDSDRNIHTNE